MKKRYPGKPKVRSQKWEDKQLYGYVRRKIAA